MVYKLRFEAQILTLKFHLDLHTVSSTQLLGRAAAGYLASPVSHSSFCPCCSTGHGAEDGRSVKLALRGAVGAWNLGGQGVDVWGVRQGGELWGSPTHCPPWCTASGGHLWPVQALLPCGVQFCWDLCHWGKLCMLELVAFSAPCLHTLVIEAWLAYLYHATCWGPAGVAEAALALASVSSMAWATPARS